MGVAPGKEIEAPEPIEIPVRAISAPELHEATRPSCTKPTPPEGGPAGHAALDPRR